MWPSWKLHSTEYLKTEEYAVYMKNVFVPKVRKASKNDGKIDGDKIGWIFEGIQGVGGSIVINFFANSLLCGLFEPNGRLKIFLN